MALPSSPRDWRGRDPFRYDGRCCACDATELECIGDNCPRRCVPPKRPAPRIPRVRMVPERQVNPFVRKAIVYVVGMLAFMAAISTIAIASMPLQ